MRDLARSLILFISLFPLTYADWTQKDAEEIQTHNTLSILNMAPTTIFFLLE